MRWWLDIDFQLDPKLAAWMAVFKRQVELIGNRVALDHGATNARVHILFGDGFRLQAIFLERGGQSFEVRPPVEFGIRSQEHEIEGFGKPWQVMKNAQAGAALKDSDIEEFGPPERVECNLLNDFLGRVFLLDFTDRFVARQAPLDDVVHRRKLSLLRLSAPP